MREHKLYNWCNRSPISVSVASIELVAKYGPLIHITQSADSLQFQHTITPAQARDMAKVLTDFADEADAMVTEVAA
ncbi:MAG: hypothetical protein Q8K57_13285 [Thiobacillus sp.]|nr:hypothetical protein [Thiobacillus sp.]